MWITRWGDPTDLNAQLWRRTLSGAEKKWKACSWGTHSFRQIMQAAVTSGKKATLSSWKQHHNWNNACRFLYYCRSKESGWSLSLYNVPLRILCFWTVFFVRICYFLCRRRAETAERDVEQLKALITQLDSTREELVCSRSSNCSDSWFCYGPSQFYDFTKISFPASDSTPVVNYRSSTAFVEWI
jgi:hypothetical protein